MANAYVVDASAAFEYLLNTPIGRTVARLIDKAELFAPELMDAEVLSALRRSVLLGILHEEQAYRVIRDLAEWRFTRVSHSSIFLDAWKHHQNVSAYDALYVATADDLDLPLITADAKLARSANLGIDVYNVREC